MTAAPELITIDQRLAANIQISMSIMIELLEARIDKSGVSSVDKAVSAEIETARAYLLDFFRVMHGQTMPAATNEQAIPSIANTPDLDDPEDQLLRTVCPIPPFPELKYR